MCYWTIWSTWSLYHIMYRKDMEPSANSILVSSSLLFLPVPCRNLSLRRLCWMSIIAGEMVPMHGLNFGLDSHMEIPTKKCQRPGYQVATPRVATSTIVHPEFIGRIIQHIHFQLQFLSMSLVDLVNYHLKHDPWTCQHGHLLWNMSTFRIKSRPVEPTKILSKFGTSMNIFLFRGFKKIAKKVCFFLNISQHLGVGSPTPLSFILHEYSKIHAAPSGYFCQDYVTIVGNKIMFDLEKSLGPGTPSFFFSTNQASATGIFKPVESLIVIVPQSWRFDT